MYLNYIHQGSQFDLVCMLNLLLDLMVIFNEIQFSFGGKAR